KNVARLRGRIAARLVTKPMGPILLAAGAVFACVAAWRVVVTALADRLVSSDPARALALEPHNPRALLAIARPQLEPDPASAAATARELLSVEPLSADAYIVLAQAAEKSGNEADAAKFNAIAMRRKPQDLGARARIVEAQLKQGEYAAALGQFDILY